MKTMCSPHYHHNSFVATHALGYMMCGYTFVFMITCVYYAHLATMRFEHSTYRELLMTTYITLLPWLAKHSLVHLYQQRVTVHHVPKRMSCHKTIVLINH